MAVLGLGYVGLTLSTVLSDIGFTVTGIDCDSDLIKNLNKSIPHFHEKGLPQLLVDISRGESPPTYQSTLSSSCAEVYIVTVGTPILRPSLKPNLDYVINATSEVGSVLKKGDLVILRSTIPVGTTRSVVIPTLEKASGLVVGRDFDVAFCPERTVEGKALVELRQLPQVIGGFNFQSSQRAKALFGNVTPTIIDLGSLEASEMLKIMDNTYRDIRFAYSNQMALICEKLNLDLSPIVRAANQGYNRNSIPLPSPGVGGACLSKDPYILSSVCENIGIDPVIFTKARDINESMPLHVVDIVLASVEANSSSSPPSIFVLGFAFKGFPETADIRDSPTIALVDELHKRNTHILGHDPLVTDSKISALNVIPSSLEEGFLTADAVIVMINHPCYLDLSVTSLVENRNHHLTLMDGWNLFQSQVKNLPSFVSYLSI